MEEEEEEYEDLGQKKIVLEKPVFVESKWRESR
jgi:hypothetical protein